MSALTKFAEFLLAAQQGNEPPDRHPPDELTGGRLPQPRGAYSVATSTNGPFNGTATFIAAGQMIYGSPNFAPW